MTSMLWPRRAGGREPPTSPRPPVFAKDKIRDARVLADYLPVEVPDRTYRFRILETKGVAGQRVLFVDHPELFYDSPIVNVDHDAHNANYGNVNLVDITATNLSVRLHRARVLLRECLDQNWFSVGRQA